MQRATFKTDDQGRVAVSVDQYSINCAGLSAAQIEERFAAALKAVRESGKSSSVTNISIQGPPVQQCHTDPAILVVDDIQYNVDLLEIGECCDLAGAHVGLISRPSQGQIVLLCFGKYTISLLGTWRYELRHGANNVINAGGTVKNATGNMGAVGIPPGATDAMRRDIAAHNEDMFAMVMRPRLEAHRDWPRRNIVVLQ